jgi:hypothetical protein
VSSLIILSSPDANAQKKGEKTEIKIILKKNDRTSGYKITSERAAYYFEGIGVEDPLTNKLLEGAYKFIYRCKESVPDKTWGLFFIKGTSIKIKIGCTVPIEPRILLADEGSPGN